MEKLTDWYALWRELSEVQNRVFARKKDGQEEDFWKRKARKFDKMVDDRWAQPDSSRQFLLQKLRKNPCSSLLDIGAGTGKWSILASDYVAKVTAFEPSLSMQEVLQEKISKDQITNIEIVTGTWPEDEVLPHDYILASHSMYGKGDFKAFVNKMNQVARKGCIMVLRAPFANSVMAVASQKVFGQPYDSPNFQIAYNALLGMDIYPDVIMEENGTWPAWRNDSQKEALEELKNRFDLVEETKYDDFLEDLLERNLRHENGQVVWPVGNRSALVYWEI